MAERQDARNFRYQALTLIDPASGAAVSFYVQRGKPDILYNVDLWPERVFCGSARKCQHRGRADTCDASACAAQFAPDCGSLRSASHRASRDDENSVCRCDAFCKTLAPSRRGILPWRNGSTAPPAPPRAPPSRPRASRRDPPLAARPGGEFFARSPRTLARTHQRTNPARARAGPGPW